MLLALSTDCYSLNCMCVCVCVCVRCTVRSVAVFNIIGNFMGVTETKALKLTVLEIFSAESESSFLSWRSISRITTIGPAIFLRPSKLSQSDV